MDERNLSFLRPTKSFCDLHDGPIPAWGISARPPRGRHYSKAIFYLLLPQLSRLGSRSRNDLLMYLEFERRSSWLAFLDHVSFGRHSRYADDFVQSPHSFQSTTRTTSQRAAPAYFFLVQSFKTI